MQKIQLDMAVRDVPQPIFAKQADVGRKFAAEILDGGEAFPIPSDAVFSVWYNGTSGEGNYSAVGENSAVVCKNNILEVELIAQMLTCHGGGMLCLRMHNPNGAQIGFWNIPYICEAVPGIHSEAAQNHYTALSEVAAQAVAAAATFTTDTTLQRPGKAADAFAVGAALAQMAPGGFGLGGELSENTAVVTDLNNAKLVTGFYHCTAGTANVPDDAFGGGVLFVANWHNGTVCAQWLLNNDLTETYFRNFKDDSWNPWQYVNPPMKNATEYLTTERWNGKPVYTKMMYLGLWTNNAFHPFVENVNVIRYCGMIGNMAVPAMVGNPTNSTLYANFCVTSNGIQVCSSDSADFIGKGVYCRIWYTKD